MKTDIHPDTYRLVVFEDLNNGQRFLTKSTAPSEETTKWEDGQSYPLVKVHISSASHPYYTGQEKLIDVEGRVDKFKARQEFAAQAQQKRQQKPKVKVQKPEINSQDSAKSPGEKTPATPEPAKPNKAES